MVKRSSLLHQHTYSARPQAVLRGKAQGGFSLLEVLIALVIFAMIVGFVTLALSRLVDYVERDREQYQPQSKIQRTWNIVLQDMLHLRPRTQRDRLGGLVRAYQTNLEPYSLIFTRGGLPAIPGTLSGMQRVAYSVDEEGQFLRWSWPSMDLYDQVEPDFQVLMGGVERVQFYQLNAANEYGPDWPPLNEAVQANALPRMVKMVINLQNGDEIERVIPGVEMPDEAVRQPATNRAADTTTGADGSEGTDASTGTNTGNTDNPEDGGR